jgi:hypothetical protein
VRKATVGLLTSIRNALERFTCVIATNRVPASESLSPRRGRARGRRVVGFFPGLGSRSFYQNLGRGLLDSGVAAVTDIYQEAACALGFPGEPEKLLLVPENVPSGRMAAQGFIGAAFLVHSLAIEAHLRATARDGLVPLRFVAYTGESFGIITAAVASGALSVRDGVKLGRAFAPLVLTAAEGGEPGDSVAAEMAAYLPNQMRGRQLVSEPYYVIGLRGRTEDLDEMLAGIASRYPATDVEVHKLYSWRQVNIYVRVGVKPSFDLFAQGFPGVDVTELKAATTFLAHTERMGGVRDAFDRFMIDNGVVFRAPHTAVVANNGAGLLTTAGEVRTGLLAIIDEVMASRTTVQTLESLRPDLVVELGLGKKSVQLLTDNDIDIPVTAYTGTPAEISRFLRAMRLADGLLAELESLYANGDEITGRHFDLLRKVFRLSTEDGFGERYVHRIMERIVVGEMVQNTRAGSPAFYRLLEIFQHTSKHRDDVDIATGELVLRARLRKRNPPGRAYAELKVIDGAGEIVDREPIPSRQPEAVVFHFDRLPGLGDAELARNSRLVLEAQPLARQVYDRLGDDVGVERDELALIYQYAMFQLLHLHRPAIFLHDYYLEGSDQTGWLVALAASGAATLPDVVKLCRASLSADAVDRLLATLTESTAPIISPEGFPLQSKQELEAATRAVFHR